MDFGFGRQRTRPYRIPKFWIFVYQIYPKGVVEVSGFHKGFESFGTFIDIELVYKVYLFRKIVCLLDTVVSCPKVIDVCGKNFAWALRKGVRDNKGYDNCNGLFHLVFLMMIFSACSVFRLCGLFVNQLHDT
ncbi:hypothetical protein D9M72_539780 [compost metagenome]